jgi:hypothetical protein
VCTDVWANSDEIYFQYQQINVEIYSKADGNFIHILIGYRFGATVVHVGFVTAVAASAVVALVILVIPLLQ